MSSMSAAFVYTQMQFRNAIRKSWKSHYCTIGTVDYTLVQQIAGNPQQILIDVRSPKEICETGQIHCSINIPLDAITLLLGPTTSVAQFYDKFGIQKPSFNTQIIFSCRSGKRARESALQATAMGYANVKIYEGSFNDWQKHQQSSI